VYGIWHFSPPFFCSFSLFSSFFFFPPFLFLFFPLFLLFFSSFLSKGLGAIDKAFTLGPRPTERLVSGPTTVFPFMGSVAVGSFFSSSLLRRSGSLLKIVDTRWRIARRPAPGGGRCQIPHSAHNGLSRFFYSASVENPPEVQPVLLAP